MDEFNSREKYLSLSELGARVRNALDNTFGRLRFWIVAEIAGLNVRNGNCYLTLIEKAPGQSEIKSEMKGIIWRNNYLRINTDFREITGNNISSNTTILFAGIVVYDIKYGLSIIIDDIEPQYTIGLLQREREKTIAMLKKLGYYKMNKSRTFPMVPQKIAVISATDSRGFEDFRDKLENNAYRYKFYSRLYSSLLQGDKAAEDIRKRLIEIYGDINKFDIVVIIRGGGGPVNLSCFDNFRLAEAVARFPLPVITGIGHTANKSVTDEVAYQNLNTPTDVADFIINRVLAFDENIKNIFGNIVVHYKQVTSEKYHLTELTSRKLKHFTDVLLMNRKADTDRNKNLLNTLNLKLISEEAKKNAMYIENFRILPKGILTSTEAFCSTQKLLLNLHSLKILEKQASAAKNYEERIRILDPVNTLERGFSITRLKGRALKSADKIKKGDIVETEIRHGKFNSKIID